MERGICASCKEPVTKINDGRITRWVHDAPGDCWSLVPTQVLAV